MGAERRCRASSVGHHILKRSLEPGVDGEEEVCCEGKQNRQVRSGTQNGQHSIELGGRKWRQMDRNSGQSYSNGR